MPSERTQAPQDRDQAGTQFWTGEMTEKGTILDIVGQALMTPRRMLVNFTRGLSIPQPSPRFFADGYLGCPSRQEVNEAGYRPGRPDGSECRPDMGRQVRRSAPLT